MIEIGNALSQLRGMVIGQQKSPRGQFDLTGFINRLGDQQIRRRAGFPGRGVVLANPDFVIAHLVEETDIVEIVPMTVENTAMRWIAGHHKSAGFHYLSPVVIILPFQSRGFFII